MLFCTCMYVWSYIQDSRFKTRIVSGSQNRDNPKRNQYFYAPNVAFQVANRVKSSLLQIVAWIYSVGQSAATRFATHFATFLSRDLSRSVWMAQWTFALSIIFVDMSRSVWTDLNYDLKSTCCNWWMSMNFDRDYFEIISWLSSSVIPHWKVWKTMKIPT